MIALISCGKAKLSHATRARELYTGNLFRAALADCERRDLPTFILSAKYALIGPTEVVTPYDLKLTDLSVDKRRRWAAEVVRRLKYLYKTSGLVDDIELHAGKAYADPLIAELLKLTHVPEITQPCQGMQIGERLHYYKERRGKTSRRTNNVHLRSL